MTDLLALTADQLAEKVRQIITAGDYRLLDETLAELVRRAQRYRDVLTEVLDAAEALTRPGVIAGSEQEMMVNSRFTAALISAAREIDHPGLIPEAGQGARAVRRKIATVLAASEAPE